MAPIADTSGRRRTASSTVFHTRLSPSARFKRPRNGTRPFSTRSPSTESTAGTTVTEPIMATSTTVMAPTASAVNVWSPARNMPAMATITVTPEMSTARPEVAAAMWIASRWPTPRARSSRSRRR